MKNMRWKDAMTLLLEGVLILFAISVLIFLRLLTRGNVPFEECLIRSLATFIASPVLLLLVFSLARE